MADVFMRAVQAFAFAFILVSISGCDSDVDGAAGGGNKTEAQWPFSDLESLIFESDSITSYSNMKITLQTNTQFWLDNSTSSIRFEQRQSSMGGLTTVNKEIANETVLTKLTGNLDDQICFYDKVNSSQRSGSASSSFSSLLLWSRDGSLSHVGVEECPDDKHSRSCDKWHTVGSLAHSQKVHKTYWIQAKTTRLLRAETRVEEGDGAYTVKWVFTKWEVNRGLAKDIFTVPDSWQPCTGSAPGLAEASLDPKPVMV